MTQSKIFLGGLPTRLDVDRLCDRIAAEPGDVATYEDVEALLGLSRDTNRFRTITAAWRRKLERERGVQTECEGGSFRFLTPDEAFDSSVRRVRLLGRAAGRLHRRVETIEPAALTGDRAKKRDLWLRETRALAEAAAKALAVVAPPKPIPSIARTAPAAPRRTTARQGRRAVNALPSHPGACR